jgi:hypothetical protein
MNVVIARSLTANATCVHKFTCHLFGASVDDAWSEDFQSYRGHY